MRACHLTCIKLVFKINQSTNKKNNNKKIKE